LDRVVRAARLREKREQEGKQPWPTGFPEVAEGGVVRFP
jgi:hypothetical protein